MPSSSRARAPRCFAATVSVLALGVALGAAMAPTTTARAATSVTIRRTAHGVPRIVASSFRGLGYGYGYAFAHDNICVIAETYVTVDGERSRYFGPDGSWYNGGNGFTTNNLNSDFFFKQVIDDHRIERMLTLAPPAGPRPEVQEAVRGYVDGYNRYLADAGPTGITDPACKGKPWVHPIVEMEAYRRFYELALLASQAVAIDGIAGAQPPPPSAGGTGGPAPDGAALAAALQGPLRHLGIGSNAVALGSDATVNGHGMLLGNPHFPWNGSERFYEAQLTIPGVLNVSGASLFGVPVINIGHNDSIAWSHTVSTAYRFTPYQLAVVPAAPTQYLVDGVPEAMTSRTMTVMVKAPDGSLAPRSRTLYRTRWGPVLTSLVGIPLPWTPAVAFAMADANEANFRYVNHFLEVNLARSSQEVLQVLLRNQGIPWVNTIATDRNGQALYADISVVPHVTDAQAHVCDTAAGAATFQLLGLPILDGSRSSCAWGSDPDAVAPGIFGPSHLPRLFRTDYVENSNDSYWLSNPRQPLEGFARIIGDERTARTLRTRVGLTMIEQRLQGTDVYGTTPKFTRQNLQDVVFSDRQFGAELARDATVAMCRAFPGGLAPSAGGPVAVGSACDALAAWDLHENLDSRGAVFWRQFWGKVLGASVSPWANGFNAANPVNTPNTLNTTDPLVQKAFGDAVNDLKGTGIPFDAPLGRYQFEMRGTTRIPIHGGEADPNGEFNAIDLPFDASVPGYRNVVEGSSFVQVVSFNGTPCPDTRTILTYSQSADPTSPFYADQTAMFSRKEWKVDEFCDAQVAADPTTVTTVLTDATPAAAVATLPNTSGLPLLPALLVTGAAAGLAWGRARARR